VNIFGRFYFNLYNYIFLFFNIEIEHYICSRFNIRKFPVFFIVMIQSINFTNHKLFIQMSVTKCLRE
jgi:hypothetical protein